MFSRPIVYEMRVGCGSFTTTVTVVNDRGEEKKEAVLDGTASFACGIGSESGRNLGRKRSYGSSRVRLLIVTLGKPSSYQPRKTPSCRYAGCISVVTLNDALDP